MILQARRYDEELGFVGRIERVNPYPIEELLRLGYVPVIAPIAVEIEAAGVAHLLNTNADTAAGEIAAALHARSLIFLTDVPGVMDAGKAVVERLTSAQALRLIETGVAAGGMIPKLEAGVRAASAGCATRIIDGTKAGALAAALSGPSGGTTIAEQA
jgi:acetylglutamate kinase